MLLMGAGKMKELGHEMGGGKGRERKQAQKGHRLWRWLRVWWLQVWWLWWGRLVKFRERRKESRGR